LHHKRTSIVLSAAVFTAMLFLYCSTLGNRPFFTRGEGREALVVAAMEQQQNLVLPRRNDAAIPSKPPLFHWLAYAAAQAGGGGINEFAVRFPSALCGALAAGAGFFVFSLVSGARTAAAASAIMLTTFEWNRSAGHARVDMVFAGFLLICQCALFFCLRRFREEGRSGAVLIGIILFSNAAAALAKGPPGLAIPWLIGGIFFATENFRTGLMIRKIPWSAVLCGGGGALVLTAVWYVLAYREGGQEFVGVQLLKENLARVVEIEGEEVGHEQPFYFSAIHLLLSSMPWSIFAPLLCLWLWRERKKVWAEGFSRYCLIWVVFFLLIVAASVSKRTVYFLPAMLPAAYLLALCLADVFQRSAEWEKWLKGYAVFIFFLAVVLFTAGVAAVLFVFSGLSESAAPMLGRRTAEDLALYLAAIRENPWPLILPFIAAIGLAHAAKQTRGRFLAQTVLGFSCSFLAIALFVNIVVLPVEAQKKSPAYFMSEVRNITGLERPLYQYQDEFYAAVFYAGRSVPVVAYAAQLSEHPGEFFLLAPQKKVPEIMSAAAKCETVIASANKAANGKDRLVLLRISRQQ